MLLELCVTELEDVALNNNNLISMPMPVVQESSHPYVDDVSLCGTVKIPGMVFIAIDVNSLSFISLLVEAAYVPIILIFILSFISWFPLVNIRC